MIIFAGLAAVRPGIDMPVGPPVTKEDIPFRILSVTFTNRAAQEMRQRAITWQARRDGTSGSAPFMLWQCESCVSRFSTRRMIGILLFMTATIRKPWSSTASGILSLDEKQYQPACVLLDVIGSLKNDLVEPEELDEMPGTSGRPCGTGLSALPV